MVIVRIFGGFASQFQKYSLGLSIAEAKKTELCIDLSDYMKGYFRPFVLHALDLPDCKILTDRKRLKHLKIISNGKQLLEEFDNWNGGDIYISGEESHFAEFFEKYPQMKLSNESKVYSYLKLKQKSEFVSNFEQQIDNTYSIGVHVRLGDFLAVGAAESLNYYKASLGHALSIHNDAKVFFFSNDIEKVKKEFGYDDRFSYVSVKNGYLGDIEEFLCFSRCKLKIISSRSGYSRFAVQLGINQYDCEKAITNEKIYGMEQSAYMLDENQISEGLSNFKYICKCENLDNSITIPECRYDTILCHPELYNEDLKTEFWKNYYGYSGEFQNIVFITSEKFNRWYNKGQYLNSIILARLGNRVLYVNTNCQDSFCFETDKYVEAKDYDGKNLNFKMYLASDSSIEISEIVKGFFNDSVVAINKDKCIWARLVFDKLRGYFYGPAYAVGSDNISNLPERLSLIKDISDVIELAEKYNR